MTRNPILGLPLHEVMRSDIALPLQQVLKVYTVGNFLSAWRNPKSQKSIEQCFETPQQARHAAGVRDRHQERARTHTIGLVDRR